MVSHSQKEVLKLKRAIAIAVANVDVWTKDGVVIFPDFTSNRQKYFTPVYKKADKHQPLPKAIGYELSKVGDENFDKLIVEDTDFFEAARYYGAQNVNLGYSKSFKLKNFSILLVRNEIIPQNTRRGPKEKKRRDCFLVGLVNQIKDLTEVPMGANAATWLKYEEPTRNIVSIICATLGEFGVRQLSAEGLQKVYLTKKSQYEPILKDRMFFFRSIPTELKLGGSKQQVNALSEKANEIYTLLCKEFIQPK